MSLIQKNKGSKLGFTISNLDSGCLSLVVLLVGRTPEKVNMQLKLVFQKAYRVLILVNRLEELVGKQLSLLHKSLKGSLQKDRF